MVANGSASRSDAKARAASRRLVGACGALAACFGAGLVAGLSPMPPVGARAAATVVSAAPGQDAPAATTASRAPSRRRPGAVAVTAGGPVASVSRNQGAAAQRLLQQLYDRVRRSRHEAGPDSDAETVTNAHSGTLDGWVDAIRYTSPQVIDDLRGAVQESVCSRALGPDETLMTARMLQWLPETASTETFDCFFQSHQSEDIALWHMLDAWRVSGMAPPPSVAAIKGWAADPRTLHRLEPADSPIRLARLRPPEAVGAERAHEQGGPSASPR